MKFPHQEFRRRLQSSTYVELELMRSQNVEYTTTHNSPDSSPDEIAANDKLSEESLPWRSIQYKQIPDRYSHNLTIASTEQKDLSSVAETKSAPDNLKWEEAMKIEPESFCLNEVWDLAEPPPN